MNDDDVTAGSLNVRVRWPSARPSSRCRRGTALGRPLIGGPILETGLPLTLVRDESIVAEGFVGPLPEAVEPLLLAPGDRRVLTRAPGPGRPAIRQGSRVVEPATIPCTLEDASVSGAAR